MDENETPDLTSRLRAHWQSNQGNWLLLHCAIVSLIGFYCIFANSFPAGGRTRPITRPATRITPQIVDLNFERPDRSTEEDDEAQSENDARSSGEATPSPEQEEEAAAEIPTAAEPVSDDGEEMTKPVEVPK